MEKRDVEVYASDWIHKTFPIDYDLPAHDPIGEIKNNINNVRFREVIQTLEQDEMLVILVFGDYRSNYYYNLYLERLALLNQAFPETIREVHVITSGTYALDPDHRRHSEGGAHKLKLPFAILWDEDDQLVERLQPDGSPARFLVNNNAQILATERLMEEEGYWRACQRISAILSKL